MVDLAVIVNFFDFSGSDYRARAFVNCVSSIDPSVWIIAVLYDPCGFLDKFEKPNLKKIDIVKADVLWQRERFWNIALKSLSSDFKYVAWIDGDIVFCESTWHKKVLEQLDTHEVVQVFSKVEDQQYSGTKKPDLYRTSVVKDLKADERILKSYFSQSGISARLGTAPGFGWASRVSTIKKSYFPDFLILGSGDKALLAALLGKQDEYALALKLNMQMTEKYLKWAHRLGTISLQNLGYVDSPIIHLVQGTYKERRYANRYSIIAPPKFDFDASLAYRGDSGWYWSQTSIFTRKVREYFRHRGD